MTDERSKGDPSALTNGAADPVGICILVCSGDAPELSALCLVRMPCRALQVCSRTEMLLSSLWLMGRANR